MFGNACPPAQNTTYQHPVMLFLNSTVSTRGSRLRVWSADLTSRVGLGQCARRFRRVYIAEEWVRGGGRRSGGRDGGLGVADGPAARRRVVSLVGWWMSRSGWRGSVRTVALAPVSLAGGGSLGGGGGATDPARPTLRPSDRIVATTIPTRARDLWGRNAACLGLRTSVARTRPSGTGSVPGDREEGEGGGGGWEWREGPRPVAARRLSRGLKVGADGVHGLRDQAAAPVLDPEPGRARLWGPRILGYHGWEVVLP